MSVQATNNQAQGSAPEKVSTDITKALKDILASKEAKPTQVAKAPEPVVDMKRGVVC